MTSCSSVSPSLSSSLLFHLRGVVLQQLRNGLREVLLLLLGLGFRINRLARGPAPHQVFVSWVVHVQRQLSHIDRRRLSRAHRTSHTTTVPTAPVPARTVAPIRVVRGELLFCPNGSLVADVQIRAVSIRLR